MPLSSEEAAHTLSQVARAEQRSARVYIYRRSSSHLFIWAAAWVAGYAGTYLSPADANRIWLVVVLLGMAGSFVMGVRTTPKSELSRATGWRMLAAVTITQSFLASVMLVIHGQGWEMGVLVPLLVGALYAGIGVWAGLRYAACGVALMVLTLVGFFYLPQYFCLWMAVVGGGVLLLTGIWFRRV